MRGRVPGHKMRRLCSLKTPIRSLGRITRRARTPPSLLGGGMASGGLGAAAPRSNVPKMPHSLLWGNSRAQKGSRCSTRGLCRLKTCILSAISRSTAMTQRDTRTDAPFYLRTWFY